VAKKRPRKKTNTNKTVFGSQVAGHIDPRLEKSAASAANPKDAHPARALIAEEEHVSESAVKRAQTIERKSPELAEKVASGEITASAALREIKKQKCFVAAYEGNATQAALKAGYSKKTAAFIGAENLKKPQIVRIFDSDVHI
jgi:chromatin remodeling complex protein RSC6